MATRTKKETNQIEEKKKPNGNGNQQNEANVISIADFKQRQGDVYQSLESSIQKRILKIQTDIDDKLLSIKTNVFEIGKLLSQAKEIIPHGQYENWVKETWGDELPVSTANLFKCIYSKFKNNPQAVKLLPITFLMKLKQKDFPESIRTMIANNPEAFKETDLKEFERAYAEFKKGKIKLDDFVKLAKQQIDIGLKILQGEAHVRNSKRAKRTAELGFCDLKSELSKVRNVVSTLRKLFPPPDENSEKEEFKDIADNDIIQEIDGCIEELQKIKRDIQANFGFFKQRIVEENGIVDVKMVSTKR